MELDNLTYQIALKLLPGIGPQGARRLVEHCGGVKEVFEASSRDLSLVPEIRKNTIKNLNRSAVLDDAHVEAEYVVENDLRTYFFLDEDYPHRLKNCVDAPVLLYGRGEVDFNVRYAVAIVGTRDCTSYGMKLTERLIEGLAPYDPIVISGLALGVDTLAHQLAVEYDLQTIGVLGHSLDRIYPYANLKLSEKMLRRGGLLTEFEKGTKPDRENFPQRNRIVAGMSDATVVIESGVKGGSMITARLAADYNRDVFAFPGSVSAPYSSGCNQLIKTHRASMIEDVDDFIYSMGWEKNSPASKSQKKMFVELSEEEKRICGLLESREAMSIDVISIDSAIPMSRTSSILLTLEFKGIVRALPGKLFELS